MPKPTPAIRTRAARPPLPSRSGAAAPLALAAVLAWAELGGGIALNPLDGLARAESLFFILWRPWILILAALIAGHWPWPRRLLLYAATLALAGAGETILLLRLGATDPWPELLRGLAVGAAAAVVADAAVQALRRWRPRLGSLAALLLLGGLLFLASGTRPYESLIVGPTAPREAAAPKPRLVLMTALPIVWGPAGAFDPNSTPAEAYRALEREFQMTPIDAIDAATLRGHRLMLLAQPRLLAPEELVALDEWVRAGGRILILTDPALSAAREFALADVHRPPDAGLLGPLLAHWGLELLPGNPQQDLFYFPGPHGPQRLLVDRPGRFAASGNSCRIAGPALVARCRIGRGEALLVADADLMIDAVWAPAGPPRGHERHLRAADNMLIVADWLDALAGIERERSDRPVAWMQPGRPRLRAMIQSALPGLLAVAAAACLFLWGLVATRRHGHSSTNLSTARSTENNSRTDVPSGP
jgi:hypothetical protein